ncbi:uncharacterized protein LOC127130447 [Lathyrus oleraceus]|uniref:uncharacterized protein LOC127130447 n=1 Tax=Pisum sativum TaxID=3888 RepID=UPI0021D0B5BF|nr:uncharacterized protein LOC127130447 [Pisum sativum]
MDNLEPENRVLKEEVSRLTALMDSLIVAQSQTAPTLATPQQRTVILEIISMPVFVVSINQHAHSMHAGFPWGMPLNYVPEGYASIVSPMSTSLPVMSTHSSVVHVMPCVKETIYHSKPFEGPDVYEKMDEIKDQFQELRKKMKTLRGKDLFGKSDVELCLVPDVKILVKFKIDNDRLLIHYFQDSLIGAALRLYMGLDSGSVQAFNDLGEAFVKQYKYNMDMEPDRDQLRAPSDFNKMVNMGMRLEEGVCEGCLSREEMSTSKKYGDGFSKKNEGETNSVYVGRQRRPYMKKNLKSHQQHHQVSSVILVFINNYAVLSALVQQQQQQQ